MNQEINLVQEDPPRGTIGDQDTVGDICDCQFCGHTFNQSYGGYFIDDADIGPDAKGGTAEIFRQEVENSGKKWLGFKEEDIGPVCDSCSWKLQNKRTGDQK